MSKWQVTYFTPQSVMPINVRSGQRTDKRDRAQSIETCSGEYDIDMEEEIFDSYSEALERKYELQRDPDCNKVRMKRLEH